MYEPIDYKSEFLTSHLITYLGNKRSLLPFIDSAITEIREFLGIENPVMFDGFSGSGSVARLFKHYASKLYVNDMESYSTTLNTCYLSNFCDVEMGEVREYINALNNPEVKFSSLLKPGFIGNNYSPVDDQYIVSGERVFYTNKNARIIDNIRRGIRMIGVEKPEIVPYLLAPLLVEASQHNNTAGVFKGFYKSKAGIGQFGGEGRNALTRIMGDIVLEVPVFCDREDCEVFISQGDTNRVVKHLPEEMDIVYYDPPYNIHPYGSNYFMLNLINDYKKRPQIQEGVSGISTVWNRSDYNKKSSAAKALDSLIKGTVSKYILISYNNEGIIPIGEFEAILSRYGTVDLKTTEYSTYKASKNTGNGKLLLSGAVREPKTVEMLWVLRKKK